MPENTDKLSSNTSENVAKLLSSNTSENAAKLLSSNTDTAKLLKSNDSENVAKLLKADDSENTAQLLKSNDSENTAQLLKSDTSENTAKLLSVSTNTSDARLKPLNTNTTKNIDETDSIKISDATGNGSDNSAIKSNGTGSDGALVQQLADQFKLVYSAKKSFGVQNLSATEMFQVKIVIFRRGSFVKEYRFNLATNYL